MIRVWQAFRAFAVVGVVATLGTASSPVGRSESGVCGSGLAPKLPISAPATATDWQSISFFSSTRSLALMMSKRHTTATAVALRGTNG